MEAAHTGSFGGDEEEPRQGFAFFNIAESKEKLKVVFDDILLVKTDDVRSRNKIICLRHELREYTVMNVSFEHLASRSGKLIMVNKFHLLSIDAIHSWRYDMITLSNIFPNWKDTQVVLVRSYRNAFHQKVG